MAFMVDQQTNFKHFCRICKKGFMCGRALGGHMRAHGIGDESGNIDDEDPAADWEDRGNDPPANKRMYALRTNPNRLKSCRACDNCGKEFLSWKSFFEHGKCSSEDAESLVSSPESDGEDGTGPRGCGWSKRKRSLRAKVGSFNSICPSSEEEDLAKCLMLLSNARVDPLEAEPEESCASASKEEERRKPAAFFAPALATNHRAPLDKAKGVAKGMFECKACKKVFNSHQALGGHRASHKKPKVVAAAAAVEERKRPAVVLSDEEEPLSLQLSNKGFYGSATTKFKVHECSVCGAEFSSGQALGGHMRRHRGPTGANTTLTLSPTSPPIVLESEEAKKARNVLSLDLNLPAPEDDHLRDSKQQQQSPLVFSATPALVDCQY